MAFTVINPANGKVVATRVPDTESSVRVKFLACQEAQKQWSRVPLAERKVPTTGVDDGVTCWVLFLHKQKIMFFVF
jgi:hypothetical protein